MMRSRAAGTLATLCSLYGCGSYEPFTLPAPAGNAVPVSVTWEARPEPVITRGAAGEWDAVDALNPSVVEFSDRFLNLYSGYDGKTWHTGVAHSTDGLHWEKKGRVLSPDAASWEGGYIAANGSLLDVNRELNYWYQAGTPPRLGLARSSDGINWRRAQQPVLETGPRGSWDERGVADPYVVRFGQELYLFYLGQDRARRQRLGMARSRDGVRWTKLRSNPILDLGQPATFDENGLGEPAVWQAHGRYWMLYTGRDRAENRRLGLAWSAEGTRWQRYSEYAVLSGSQPWNSRVLCDPSVIPSGEMVRVWFGGGDVAHPAENIHGQIGYAELRLIPKQ